MTATIPTDSIYRKKKKKKGGNRDQDISFCKVFFFININFIIINNWILTLLVKITCNLINKDVQN